LNPFNLAKLVVGSEGTLAVVTEAKVKILPQPKTRAVMVTHFHQLIEAMVATQEILPCGPSAVELLDKTILDLARGSLEYGRLSGFIQGDPEAILITEFYGDSPQDLRQKMEHLEERLRKERFGYALVPAFDPAEQANIWKVRKAGLGLLLSIKGDKKPIAFVEDTAVSPEKLPEYLPRFNQIIGKYHTSSGFYGHCSVGCLHIRPLINLKEPAEIKKMRALAEEICDLVLEFAGALSGEHGDGLARSMWNKKLFGPTLYRAFQEVKAAFDPQGLMNPGKIVEAPDMTENLRYGPYYRTREVQTHLSFAREGGLAAAVEQCSGVGACRKKQEGTMCPSYMVTLEEEHSTRGRANALRLVLSGRLPAEALTSHRLQEVLDLCLECKGCKAECPAGVDMAKLKYEILAHYYEEHGFPLRARLFANIETLNRLGCLLAPFSNWLTATPPLRWLLHRFCGIDKRRVLPPFARPTLPTWFRKRVSPAGGSRGTVVLFNDTFMNYNYPEVGKAAVTLLERAGFRVILPNKRCCGRPMISKGMLAKAKEQARYNVAQLATYVEQGATIVGCEPSCLLTLRDEYPDLLEDKRAELVAQSSYLMEEFLCRLAERGELDLSFREASQEVLFHGHCHQKALVGTRPSLQVLRLIPGLQVKEVDSGCCGMAGAFGYEKEHYDLSLAIGERRLFKEVRAQPPQADIVVAGVSCRQQIEHGTGRRPKHLVEVLAQALC
jgi:Fe-S oxidoreductase